MKNFTQNISILKNFFIARSEIYFSLLHVRQMVIRREINLKNNTLLILIVTKIYERGKIFNDFLNFVRRS